VELDGDRVGPLLIVDAEMWPEVYPPGTPHGYRLTNHDKAVQMPPELEAIIRQMKVIDAGERLGPFFVHSLVQDMIAHHECGRVTT
jgi:hypothetical protein